MLLCLVTTSSQALDGLFTVDTWGATLSLGKLVASQTWLATLFLSNTWLRVLLLAKLTAAKTWLAVKLAGSVGLAVVCSDFASVVLVLLAGATFIWIVAIYDAQLEAEKARYYLERRHWRSSQSLERKTERNVCFVSAAGLGRPLLFSM